MEFKTLTLCITKHYLLGKQSSGVYSQNIKKQNITSVLTLDVNSPPSDFLKFYKSLVFVDVWLSKTAQLFVFLVSGVAGPAES